MLTHISDETTPDRLYKATTNPRFVEVPAMNFLMIDGKGDPNTAPAYQDAVAALYALSYALKFSLKQGEGLNYRVGPLEGQWWTEEMATFSVERKQDWQWTMMIAQPATVNQALVDTVREEVRRKKALPALDQVRLERFTEGRAAQVLHRGPYATEGPTIERLHRFIHEQGASLAGRHHEIYLSDPRRAAPERMRTILRQPVV